MNYDGDEVQVILHALLFCRQFDFHNIMIESDSSLSVGWVMHKDRRSWRILREFCAIDNLMPLVQCVGIRYIIREGNQAADYFAKL